MEPRTAARIFTGAPIPPGADAVAIQEVCERDGDWVLVPAGAATAGANIRRAGEDIRSGTEAIPTGTRLAPQHLGLAASVGVDRLRVYRRLRVALFSSGDELALPGQPLAPGHIYNSNRYTLIGLLQGYIGSTPFLGSPGNPVSLFATFCLFARSFILRLQGVAGDVTPRSLKVRSGFDWPRPDRRREFQRARLRPGADGDLEALVHGSRSSGILSSVTWAEGFVEIPEGRVVRRGDLVDFIPFDALLN